MEEDGSSARLQQLKHVHLHLVWGVDCKQLPKKQVVGKHLAPVVTPGRQEFPLRLLVEDLAANDDEMVAEPVQIVQTLLEGEAWLVRPELLRHRLRISQARHVLNKAPVLVYNHDGARGVVWVVPLELRIVSEQKRKPQ